MIDTECKTSQWATRCALGAVLLVLLCTSSHAQGERGIRRIGDGARRVALVVGNNAYASSPLQNAVNDARSIAGVLEQMGFAVSRVEDASYRELGQAVDRFVGQLGNGDVGLFYYSGHGIQLEGKNYLVPVDFAAKNEIDAKYEAYAADRVREHMERSGAQLNILVLDACRDNPFRGTKALGGGLGRMELGGEGTLIAYATRPNETADDNRIGVNGLFTHHLLQALQTPGLELDDVFERTQEQVYRASGKTQFPWVDDNVIGEFYFAPGQGGEAQVVPPPPLVEDVVLGHLQVIANAPNSQVYVNGTYKGVAGPGQPLNLSNLPLGTVRVVVKANGYEDGSGTYALRANDWVQARVSLVAVAPPPPPLVVEAVDESNGGGTGGACGSDMVWVEAGEFMMGSDDGRSNEKPVHRVYLDGYCIDKYEVTVDAYARCVRAGACQEPKSDHGEYTWGKSGQGTHPVSGVSWKDAVDYCGWAGKRLPTEAEWEKAARGTDGRVYPWGNAFGTGRANFADSNTSYYWSDKSANDGFQYTSPVGHYHSGKSPYGVYDMAGNVWEWVADWYSSSYYASSPSRNPPRNPPGPSSGSSRVVRGGSWSNTSNALRAANRNDLDPDVRFFNVGIRCARQ